MQIELQNYFIDEFFPCKSRGGEKPDCTVLYASAAVVVIADDKTNQNVAVRANRPHVIEHLRETGTLATQSLFYHVSGDRFIEFNYAPGGIVTEGSFATGHARKHLMRVSGVAAHED